jgi:bacterioferritin-associated ferredoxin
MFVCICNGVTDSSIRREMEAGATSFADVQKRLGVARQCGSCEHLARSIVNEFSKPDPQFFYNASPDESMAAVA